MDNFQDEKIGMHELKQRAKAYYATGDGDGVLKKMEEVLNAMFYDKPEDVFGHLANYFESFAKQPTISELRSRAVLDSRCHVALQVEIYCTIKNVKKLIATSVASSIFSADENDDVDGACQKSIDAAIMLVENTVADKVTGTFAQDQHQHDNMLIDLFKQLQTEQQPPEAEATKPVEAETVVTESPATKGKKSPPPTKGKGKAVAVVVIPDEPAELLVPGCEAASAVSQAVCKAAASLTGRQLYEYIAACHSDIAMETFRMPLPMMTVMASGKNVAGKLRCVKEFMVVPAPGMPILDAVKYTEKIYNYCAKTLAAKAAAPGRITNDFGALCPQFDRPEQGVDLLQEAISSLGLSPGVDFHLALNCAAHEALDFEKGKYDVAVGTQKTSEELVKFWQELLHRYPSIIAIIDPMRKQDAKNWMTLAEAVSPRCYIVGDYVYHRPGRLRNEDLPLDFKTSAVVLYLQHVTTVTDILACVQKMTEADNQIVIGCSITENADKFAADLAVGCQARFIKVGAPCRAERVRKLNRLLEIESQLISDGRLQADNERHVFVSLSIPPTAPQPDDAVSDVAMATTPVPDKHASSKQK